MEKCPWNCGFLSLVAVERVLIVTESFTQNFAVKSRGIVHWHVGNFSQPHPQRLLGLLETALVHSVTRISTHTQKAQENLWKEHETRDESRPKKSANIITLRSEIITQLIPQKLFRAMITWISRNPAANNSSEVFWRNDKMAIAQINSWKHATKTVSNERATTKMRNRPENNSPRVISRNRLWQFRAIPRKIILQ